MTKIIYAYLLLLVAWKEENKQNEKTKMKEIKKMRKRRLDNESFLFVTSIHRVLFRKPLFLKI
jgi:hypothetical protein